MYATFIFILGLFLSFKIFVPLQISSTVPYIQSFVFQLPNTAILNKHSPHHYTTSNMIWGYPIFGDSPKKKRRKKIDPIWELGENRASPAWDYEVANMLSQDYNYIPWHGTVVSYEETGLGKTQAMTISAQEAVGKCDIDPKEVERISQVLPTFDQGNGTGIVTLLSAKNGHFSFKYNGLLKNRFGIQNYLRYMITRVYPQAKITLLTEHWLDSSNLPASIRDRKIPLGLTAEERKRILWKKPYFHEHESVPQLPERGGTDSYPQSIS